MNIASLLQNVLVDEKTLCKSERSQLIKEMYELYTSDMERILRKKENWKNYVSYLKENKLKHSFETVEKFKKNKRFFKEYDITTFSILINKKTGHGLQKLYIMLSICKDKNNRKEPVSPYILYNEKRNLEKNKNK